MSRIRIASILMLTLILCVNSFAQKSAPTIKGKLTIWCYSDELKTIANRFSKAYPGITVNCVLTPKPNDAYLNKLNSSLRSNAKDSPDIFASDVIYLRQFIDSGYFEDLSAKPYSADVPAKDLAQYTVDLARDDRAHIRALSWQASPGGIFYRRGLAKEYFGTDDPEKISAMYANFEDLLLMSRIVKDKSGGSVKLFTDYPELLVFPLAARKSKWIVNNKLVIEGPMLDFLELSKSLRDEDLTAKIGQWSPAWYQAISDKSVFSFVLPSLDLNTVLMPYAESETFDAKSQGKTGSYSGDWALASGPSAYFWGETWLGINAKSANKDIAWEFIKFAAFSKDFLKAWAKESGEFLANAAVAAEIAPSFNEEFLGGQNQYIFWQKTAKLVNGTTASAYDTQINKAYCDQLALYADGKKTREQAIADFRKKVKALFPKVDAGL